MQATYKSKSSRMTDRKLAFAILFAFSLGFIVNFTASAQGPTPTDDDVNRVAKQLYCPVCESTPLDVCPTEACRQWRELIRTMLADGKSDAEIKQYFVEHYGARVLAEPPNRAATYLVPVIVILLGAFLLLRGFQMWMKRPSPTEAGGTEAKHEAQPAQHPYVAKLAAGRTKR